MRTLLDTTVLVASVVGQHPHHARAMSVVRPLLRGDDEGWVSAHGLAELYAVLTTLPVTPRIAPEAASKLIGDNVLAHFQTIALTAREYAKLVARLPEAGAMGGATYDVIHLACARKARVERVYTFNVQDFRRLGADLAERVVAP